MDAEEILARARSGDSPSDWRVFPLLRRKVILAIFGWAFGILMGFSLFGLVWYIVVPSNFHAVPTAIFSVIMLGILAFIGLGSVWTMYIDIQRLRQLDNHVIVLTSTDFVKQEGNKMIHVPLVNVRHVTARGAAPVDRTAPSGSASREVPKASENVMGFIFGRRSTQSGQRVGGRKRMRTPTSLAFIDTRTDKEVTVLEDTAYGDPFLIAAFLKDYTRAVQTLS